MQYEYNERRVDEDDGGLSAIPNRSTGIFSSEMTYPRGGAGRVNNDCDGYEGGTDKAESQHDARLH